MLAAGAANAAAPYLKKSRDTCNVVAVKKEAKPLREGLLAPRGPGTAWACHASVATRGLLPNDPRPSSEVQQQRRPGSGV